MDNSRNLPGPGPGRALGSNKNRVLKTDDLIDLLNNKDYDPVIAQIDLARDPKCPHSTRHKINSDFMKLLYPALKSVEHSGTVQHNTLNISWDVTAQKTVSVEPTVDVIASDTDSETD